MVIYWQLQAFMKKTPVKLTGIVCSLKVLFVVQKKELYAVYGVEG